MWSSSAMLMMVVVVAISVVAPLLLQDGGSGSGRILSSSSSHSHSHSHSHRQGAVFVSAQEEEELMEEDLNTMRRISISVSSSSSPSSSSSCFGVGERIDVSFVVLGEDDFVFLNNNFDELWIGIDNIVGNRNMMWVWLCGSQTCDPSSTTFSSTATSTTTTTTTNTTRIEGTVSFDGQDQMWEPNLWPLRGGTYRAVLAGSTTTTAGATTTRDVVLAASQPFEIVDVGTTTTTGSSGSGSGPSSSSSCGSGSSSEAAPAPAAGPAADSSDMVKTIQDAKNDIAALIQEDRLLVGKFLRLAFHDCVGGCDGCIDMTNLDNAGLVMPINSLRPVVDKYEPQEVLSRTDIWMLSAVVASEVSTGMEFEFPFQWVGRRTCEELNNVGGDDSSSSSSSCGRGADGMPSPCGPFGGPHRALCHGDIDGTRTIQQFMSDEFGFDAQETTAIMGAHSVGAMRAVNLGFEGRRGWDLTNNDLDRGYFVELVGSRNDPDSLPDWQQTLQNNDGLNGIPDRWQFQATVDGRPLTMLNSDVALVRNLVEGENLTPDGRVTCDFKGENSCDTDTPFMPFVIRYAQDLDTFLSDYRDALNKMIDNGYIRDFRCPAGQVCTLRPR